MTDLSIIQPYIREPDEFTKNYLDSEVSSSGFLGFYNFTIKLLDCTRILDDGKRLMQTIGYPYVNTISQLVYAIENYAEENDKDSLYNNILAQHKTNIEFEELNPPIWYDGEKGKKQFEKTYKVKTKTTKEKKPREPKVTSSEKRLALKVAKLNNLSFKIKPQT